MPVTSAQYIIGTEKYFDAGIKFNFDDDEYSQRYGQIEKKLRLLTKDDILQPYKSDQDFRSSNIRVDDVRYNLYVFGVKYQQIFTASQPSKVEFKSDGVVLIDINGYALILTYKMLFVDCDGQRHFD